MARPRKPWFRASTGWWMVEINGRQEKLVHGFENKTAAEQKFHALMAEVLDNPPLDVGKNQLTVLSLLDGYLDHFEGALAARTWYERKRIIDRFGQFCVDRKVRLVKDCLPLHLEQFLKANPTWKSRDTLAEVVKTIKAVFNWGHKMGVAPPSPFAGKVSYTFGNRRRPMTEDEFRLLIGACGPSLTLLREILQFCYWTGARPKEARTARWSDLDLGRGTLTLKEHKTAKTQKEYKPRVIYLTDEVTALLAEARRRQPESEFVFTNCRGRPYHRNSIQQNLRRLRRKVGLPEDVKLYGCRHGFGTRAALRGENMAVLAELMGHEEGSPVTAHYVHLADQHRHLKEALKRINRPG